MIDLGQNLDGVLAVIGTGRLGGTKPRGQVAQILRATIDRHARRGQHGAEVAQAIARQDHARRTGGQRQAAAPPSAGSSGPRPKFPARSPSSRSQRAEPALPARCADFPRPGDR